VRIIIISREKIWLLLGGLLFAITSLSIYTALFTDVWKVQSSLSELRVLIDPGHGGVDGGAKDSQGNLEKQINLKIALYLRDHLRQSGLHVVLTRETDIDLAPFSLLERGRHRRDLLARIHKARDNKCLLLISIHCDWSKDPHQQGAKVFYHIQSSTGRRLAEVIQRELNTLQQISNRASSGEFFIIKQQGVNGVIVEVGMLSNFNEAKMLQNQNYQEQLALAIAKGILEFCCNYLPKEPPAFKNIFNLEKME
jgi:N-acetylmuramoyl-L-alanine amidase